MTSDKKQNTKPLDLSRYNGIKRETWTWTDNQTSPSFPVNRFLCAEPTSEHPGGYGVIQHTAYWDIHPEFRNLLADAPLLLAEVKRLRDRVDVLEREMYVVAKELESKSKFLDDDRAKRYCSLVVERALRIRDDEGGDV